MKSAKPVKSAKAVDLDALLAQIEATLATHAALPATQLRAVKRHLPALRERLEARGLEVSANVRRPLAAQLLAALEAGFTPLKGIEKRVAGATPREVKVALQGLVDDGRARDVVRPSGPGVMLTATAESLTIPHDEVAALLRQLVAAQRLLKRAVPKRGGRSAPAVLREDLALARFVTPLAPLAPLAPRASVDANATSAAARPTDAAETSALSQTIRAHVAESTRPIRVPDLLRALGIGAEAGKRALLAGASAGLFGLEPESGMARLAPDEALWCPEGPQGTRLSWIVAREPRAPQRTP